MPISDELWQQIANFLPNYDRSPKGGRPRLCKRKVFEGILFVFQNQIPWKGVPTCYGSATALNDYFRSWAREGVFHHLKVSSPAIERQLNYLDWEKINLLGNKFH